MQTTITRVEIYFLPRSRRSIRLVVRQRLHAPQKSPRRIRSHAFMLTTCPTTLRLTKLSPRSVSMLDKLFQFDNIDTPQDLLQRRQFPKPAPQVLLQFGKTRQIIIDVEVKNYLSQKDFFGSSGMLIVSSVSTIFVEAPLSLAEFSGLFVAPFKRPAKT